MDQPETVDGILPVRTSSHTFLLCCGLLGLVLLIVIYFALGAIVPGYDIIRQPIGDLELTKYGWIQTLNFIVVGLLNCAFAVGLRKELKGGFGSALIPLSYLVISVGFFLNGIFIHDPIHGIARFITFVSVLISSVLFARRFAGDLRWQGWATFTVICTMLIVIMMALSFEKSNGGAYVGLFERLAIITRLGWAIPFIMTLLDGRRLTQED